MAEENIKIITSNKKAYYEYFLSDFYEAGIELVGTEIKSLRYHGCSLADSYILIKNDEAYILGMNITPYYNGNLFNHEPLRTRKLLLHKQEIRKLKQKITTKGYTIVCTKVYLKKGRCKLEIALAKGKKLYDKKEAIKERDIQMENKKLERY
jgi:SsrA-binding protein